LCLCDTAVLPARPTRRSSDLHRCRADRGETGGVRDKTPDPQARVQFAPSILPVYLRRTDAIEELIPWLYLKGISTGDFGEALQADRKSTRLNSSHVKISYAVF